MGEREKIAAIVDRGELIGTAELLEAIADAEIERRGVAVLYGIALRLEFGQTDWPVVNRAIMARWSLGGLKYIKKVAWKAIEVAVTA